MVNRIQGDDPIPPDVAAVAALHRSGWSIGDLGLVDANGRPHWIVSGSNGENLVRAEGSSPAEAWGRALDQARSLGMLGRSGVGDC